MTGVKKESHQHKTSPRRLQQSPDAITLSIRTRPPADIICIIPSEVIIEINMDNDATTDKSRVFDSVSSFSGSDLLSASTLSTTESQSPRLSSFSRTNIIFFHFVAGYILYEYVKYYILYLYSNVALYI